jgi:hypothetical protein
MGGSWGAAHPSILRAAAWPFCMVKDGIDRAPTSWVSSFPEQGTCHWPNGIAAGPNGIAFAVGINTSGSGGPVSIEWAGYAWVQAYPAPPRLTPILLRSRLAAPPGQPTADDESLPAGGYTIQVIGQERKKFVCCKVTKTWPFQNRHNGCDR